MKVKLVTAAIVLALAQFSFAIGDLAIGPFYGMAMPVGNDLVKAGPLYGLQAKLELIPMLSIGAHYSSRDYGNPTIESDILGEQEIDGGSVSSFGVDAFLGKTTGMVGANLYLSGSFGTFKWKRDGFAEESKSSLAFGPGVELVLPMKIGIEGRAMLEVVSTGNEATWKAFTWYVGANYHFSLTPGPM